MLSLFVVAFRLPEAIHIVKESYFLYIKPFHFTNLFLQPLKTSSGGIERDFE